MKVFGLKICLKVMGESFFIMVTSLKDSLKRGNLMDMPLLSLKMERSIKENGETT